MDERKNQQIQVHPLTPLYMCCHMQLWCKYFGHNWSKWCVAMCSNIELIIIIILLLLLFWNNLQHSIQMLGYVILWHMAQCKYATWHLKKNLIQNINIKLAGA